MLDTGVISSPESVGMDGNKLSAALKLLDREIELGEIPGGVALVGRHGRIVGSYCAGLSVDTDTDKQPVTLDTIYDCASLTKVTVTLPLILLLIERGEIRLQDKVTRFIPAFAANGKEEVTVGQLLSHTGGLAAFRDFYSHGRTPVQMK